MHELSCPSCNTSSLFNISDYLVMCPMCNTTFHLDTEVGKKTIYNDHFIIPNRLDSAATKDLTLEWLKRIHHQPSRVESEHFVVDVRGVSLPMWVISLEGHTAWKGLVQKQRRGGSPIAAGTDYLTEEGHFRRSYRWAVNARDNICEMWGLTRLHQPVEDIQVDWDGFPFDSTMSRGKLLDTPEGEDGEPVKEGLEGRKFFEFKLANGLPILGVQVTEHEAMRRAKDHVLRYHYRISELYADYLLDCKTELEIAGIQLVHVPIWQISYVHRPRTFYRHFYEPTEKRLLMDGNGRSVLVGELAINHYDKMKVNAIICLMASGLLFLFGIVWHPAFYLVALFTLIVAGVSHYLHLGTKAKKEEDRLKGLFATKEQTYSHVELEQELPMRPTGSN